MKKVIAWLLVLALTAAISIGATLAYLTDTDEDVNVMTLGKVKIDQLEYQRVDVESKDADAEVQEFHDNKPLLPAVTENGFDYTPGDTYVDWEQIGKDGYTSTIWDPTKINNEVDKMVFVKNKGDYDAYVRSIFAFEAGKYTTLDEFKKMVHLNLNETDYTWEWIETPVAIANADGTETTNYFIATATYNKVLTPGALTEISLSQIALDKTATNEDVEAFGDTYQVLVKSQGIQADGFTDADTALTEGFGMIAANNLPWESDAATKGIDLRSALHYLEGDTTTSAITANVRSITFGLNEDYAAITDSYEGTLVDVDQDVPVYAYYVPSSAARAASNYDVYFLADDVIYTPVDSKGLFQNMTALTGIDSRNLNTSRTKVFTEAMRECNALVEVIGIEDWDVSNVTGMDNVFRHCYELRKLDLSKWNTANVETLDGTFRGCKKLLSLDVSGWKTGNVKTMLGTFQDCSILETVDVSGWDTSNVTNMTQLFNRCNALTTLDVSGWDVGKVTSMQIMFQECFALRTINTTNWDTSNVTTMWGMFRSCIGLEELDVSNWDVSKVTTFASMFSGYGSNAMDMKLKEIDVSKWQPTSAVELNHMFYGCAQLTELDLSGWDMPNLHTTSHMFADCINLEVIDVSGWQTTDKWYSMDGMFNDCRKVKSLDVSSFTTSGVAEFAQIFDACWALEEIKGLENWDTSNGCVFDEMFLSCGSLKELNLSSFDTRNARKGFKMENNDTYNGFYVTFGGVNKLEKLILGENFVFAGNGTVKPEHQPKFPNPAAIDGQETKWYNAANNTYYDASEIPEPGDEVVTYVAAIPPANP